MDTSISDNEFFVTTAAEASRDSALAIGELPDFEKCWEMEMSYGEGWEEVIAILGEEATKTLYASVLKGAE